MKNENFQALASELTQLTPHQRSILSDRLREIEPTSVPCTLIEKRLSIEQTTMSRNCSKEHIVRGVLHPSYKVTFNALTGTSLASLRHIANKAIV